MADGNEEAKIFVGGLSWETNEDKLRNYFSVFGDVTECLVMKNQATGKSRGFGFVTFLDPNSVKKVLCIHNHQLDGRPIDPKECNPRTAAKTRKDYKQVITSKIFLGGLPPNITETNLREFFSKYGNVTEAIIMFDQEKKKSRGFGFLSFDSEDSINKVVAEHYVNINGKQVEVKRAEPQLAKSGTPVPNGNIPHGPNIPMPYYMQPWNMWTAAQMMSPPTPYGWNPTTAAAAAAAITATAAASQQPNWTYPGYSNWTALQSPFGPTPPIPFGPGAQNASGATNAPGLHHHHHGPGPHGSAAAAVAAAAAAAAASQPAPGAAAGFITTPNNMAAALNHLPNGSGPSLPSGMMPTALATPGIGNFQHDANNYGGSRPNGPYPYNAHTNNNNGVSTAMTGGWNSSAPATFGNPNGTGSNGPSTGVQGTNAAAAAGNNIQQQVATQSSQQPQNINDPMSSAYNQFHGSRGMVQNSGYHPYRRS